MSQKPFLPCWLLVAKKISTTDSLRRGLVSRKSFQTCCLCKREWESVDHLFLHCDFALCLWGYFFYACGVTWSILRSIAQLFKAWRGNPLAGLGLILWKIIAFSILWSVWKERNKKILNGKEASWENLLSSVTLRIAKWDHTTKGVFRY